MTPLRDFGLYVILTKPVLPHVQIAEICVRTGVKMLQLREKDLSDREILRLARELTAVTRSTDTRFILNDRPDLARLSGADGLHLGQDDVSLAEIRDWFPQDAVFGLSSHSIEQAKDALGQKPAYIGFGPVYPTPTKAKPDPAVGLEPIRTVVGMSPVPVVAIGGIFPENMRDVLKAGAKNLCLVRHLMEGRDVEDRIRRLQDVIGEEQSYTTRSYQ